MEEFNSENCKENSSRYSIFSCIFCSLLFNIQICNFYHQNECSQVIYPSIILARINKQWDEKYLKQLITKLIKKLLFSDIPRLVCGIVLCICFILIPWRICLLKHYYSQITSRDSEEENKKKRKKAFKSYIIQLTEKYSFLLLMDYLMSLFFITTLLSFWRWRTIIPLLKVNFKNN